MTKTDFFGKKITLAQTDTGHRAGTDAVLLAGLVEAKEAGCVVDAGAASGAVGLAIAARLPEARLCLVDLSAEDIALARQNIIDNGFSNRMEARTADLLRPVSFLEDQGLKAGKADCVVTNPPYLDGTQDRVTDNVDKMRAHVMPTNGLHAWIKTCHALLKSRGRLHLIHRADRFPEVIDALGKGFGGIVIRPVHAYPDKAAIRILVSATKNSRAALSLMPGVILHQTDGRFTPWAEALHRGEADFTSL